MRRGIARGLGPLLATLLLAAGCTSAPFTGRQQFILIGEAQELQLGASAYQEVMKKAKLSTDTRKRAIVERVARRIARAADRHLTELGRQPFDWEVRLVESKQKNAFALPGGKIVVYTGILTVMQNEAQLATVLGHEVAHAIQRHGAERLSQGLVAQLGAAAVAKAMEKKDPQVRSAVLGAFGLGANIGVLLPYSRSHEEEADYVGVLLMAEAGYDPAEAVRFWERFSSAKGEKNVPEFLSTHPADATRIALLKQHLPEAQARYRAAPERYGSGESL